MRLCILFSTLYAISVLSQILSCNSFPANFLFGWHLFISVMSIHFPVNSLSVRRLFISVMCLSIFRPIPCLADTCLSVSCFSQFLLSDCHAIPLLTVRDITAYIIITAPNILEVQQVKAKQQAAQVSLWGLLL